MRNLEVINNKIIELIGNARESAMRKVNEELIMLYWNVGEYLHNEAKTHNWGDNFIDEVAKGIKEKCPGIKGFNRRGLYRMKQFYEAYVGNIFVSTVLTQIGWSNHMAILSATKTARVC